MIKIVVDSAENSSIVEGFSSIVCWSFPFFFLQPRHKLVTLCFVLETYKM